MNLTPMNLLYFSALSMSLRKLAKRTTKIENPEYELSHEQKI